MTSCNLKTVLNFNQNFVCSTNNDVQKIDLTKYDDKGIFNVNALYLPVEGVSQNTVEKCIKPDPRLSRGGGQYVQLDREISETIPKPNLIYTDPELRNYGNLGKSYKNYEDIKAGQIKYYFDKDIEHFYKPHVVNGNTINCSVYTDPMGSNRFQFNRVPDKPYCPYKRDENTKYENCLSFVEDTNFRSSDLIFSYDTNLPKNTRTNTRTRH
jgi:hypothetical protein